MTHSLNVPSISVLTVFLMTSLPACEEKNTKPAQETKAMDQSSPLSVGGESLAGEATSQAEAYHLEPFFYSSDQLVSVTGLCFSYSQKAYDNSDTLKSNPKVKPGACPESVSINSFSGEEKLAANMIKRCDPYQYEGKDYARLTVYDVSYEVASGNTWQTSDEIAQEHCEFQEPLSVTLLAD